MNADLYFFTSLPPLPEGAARRRVYVDESLDDDMVALLKGRGWDVIDLRLMPRTTTGDKIAVLQSTLEAVNFGSITRTKDQLKMIEAEGRLYGVFKGGEVEEATTSKDDERRVLTEQEIMQLFRYAKRPKNRSANHRKDGSTRKLYGIVLTKKLQNLEAAGYHDIANRLRIAHGDVRVLIEAGLLAEDGGELPDGHVPKTVEGAT